MTQRPPWSMFDAQVETMHSVLLDTRTSYKNAGTLLGTLLYWLVLLEDRAPDPALAGRVVIARADLLRAWARRGDIEGRAAEDRKTARKLRTSLRRALRGRAPRAVRETTLAQDLAHMEKLQDLLPGVQAMLTEGTELVEMFEVYATLRGDFGGLLDTLPPLDEVEPSAHAFVTVSRRRLAEACAVLDASFATRARAQADLLPEDGPFSLPTTPEALRRMFEPGSGEPPEVPMLDERVLDSLAWIRLFRATEEMRLSRVVGRSIGLALSTRAGLFARPFPSTLAGRRLFRSAVLRIDVMVERLARAWGRALWAGGETEDDVPDVPAVLERIVGIFGSSDVDEPQVARAAGRALSDLFAAQERVAHAATPLDPERARFRAAVGPAIEAILDHWTSYVERDAPAPTKRHAGALLLLGLTDDVAKLDRRASKAKR